MRAQVSIQFIENFKLTTAQKAATAENPSDLVTSVSFNCKMNPITALRLQSLLKQGSALDCNFVARQATFDWQADAGMDVIRKVSEEQAELPLSKADMIPVPIFNVAPAAPAVIEPLVGGPGFAVIEPEDAVKAAVDAVAETQAAAEIVAAGAGILETPKNRVTYDNTGKEEPLCPRCADSRTPNCAAPECFDGLVTSCTGFHEKAALADTVQVAAEEPKGNGHDKTRYIPGAGKGRRKRAVAG